MKELYTESTIKYAVLGLAETVQDRAIAALHVHVIMDGAFMFAADFVRVYEGKIAKVTFLRILRGYEGITPHPPRLLFKWPRYTRGLNPHYTHLILDVCTETGATLEFARNLLDAVKEEERPKQLLTCALVGIRRLPSSADIVGLLCRKNVFLTGYGMGPSRDFPSIYGIPK